MKNVRWLLVITLFIGCVQIGCSGNTFNRGESGDEESYADQVEGVGEGEGEGVGEGEGEGVDEGVGEGVGEGEGEGVGEGIGKGVGEGDSGR